MNSPNPAYYEALATARSVRPAPARSWSILLTSTNHGVVGPRGSTFPHAGEHHERVVVVEVPAGAGAPVDQVDLKLVSGAGAAAADAHPAPGHFAVTKLEEVISWVAQLPVPTRGACTMINKLREARYALLAAPVAAQAGQVAVPADMTAAADFIDKRAEQYLQDHADNENDTGAVVFHYGEAGREYHSVLVDLADDLRQASKPAACAVPPVGWNCTRAAGHEGPCAAAPSPAKESK